MSTLPAPLVRALTQLRGSGPAHWKLAARLLDEHLRQPIHRRQPHMQVYEAAAHCLGQQTHTIRNWVSIYRAVGGALIDRYEGTFRYAHWRAMVPAARRAYRPLPLFAAEIAAAAADATQAGLHLPVEAVIEQAAAATQPPRDRFRKRLHAARDVLALLVRDAEAISPALRREVLVIASALEDLEGKPRSETGQPGHPISVGVQ